MLLAVASVAFAADAPKAVEIRLGVSADPLPAKKAADLGLAKNVGLVVTAVEVNTPAGKAGVKRDDILAEIGGKPVPADPAALRKLVQELPKGDQLTLVVFRDGAKTELPIGPLDPAARVGKLENEAKPQGKLENTPASQGTTNFNVMSAQADQDGFRVFASGEGLSYDVRGRFRGGKKIPTAIKITDDGKVIAEVATLDKVPEGHKTAVEFLLGAVNKN
jgi:membrane-associated protease RseP (regulator of RpoE activity)